MCKQRFAPGQVVVTPGALDLQERRGIVLHDLLARHVCGDWGDLGAEDKQENGFTRPGDVVVIDAPQIEDHAAIAQAAIRAASEVVVPVAPTPIEIARSAPVRGQVVRAAADGSRTPRIVVLLNRCVTGANSTSYAREALTGLEYDVLSYTVPRLEMYAQSFGGPVPGRDPIWELIARELLDRAHLEVAR